MVMVIEDMRYKSARVDRYFGSRGSGDSSNISNVDGNNHTNNTNDNIHLILISIIIVIILITLLLIIMEEKEEVKNDTIIDSKNIEYQGFALNLCQVMMVSLK